MCALYFGVCVCVYVCVFDITSSAAALELTGVLAVADALHVPIKALVRL